MSSSKSDLYDEGWLGDDAHQTVTIDATIRYSVRLTPGELYEVLVDSEPCYCALFLDTDGNPAGKTIDSTHTWIPAGGGRNVPVPSRDTGFWYIGVVRAGSGSGTLHINKATGTYTAA